jgi:hypothetical protein
VVIDQWDVQSDHVQVTAHHHGYDYLTGKPVLSRSIYYDKQGTMLILDLAEGLQSHTYTTSFLVPGANKQFDLAAGWFKSTTAASGNVYIKSLLRTGQTANRATKFVSNNPPPNEEDTAQRFYIQQAGTFVAFATLVTAYNGTTVPDITANWITANPTAGNAIQIQLIKNGIAISMDGKGAWRDNVFVERLWRSVKYEEVYLRAYDSVSEARKSIGRYLDFYNGRRPHSSLDRRTPDQVYFTPLPIRMAA